MGAGPGGSGMATWREPVQRGHFTRVRVELGIDRNRGLKRDRDR